MWGSEDHNAPDLRRGVVVYLGATMTLRYDDFSASHMLRCDHPACPALFWCGQYGMARMNYQIDAWHDGWRRRWHGEHPRDLCPSHATD